ncbi:MAG: hypothetical protein GY706_07790 [Bacteroides sp.]|nr:hypothetical protein [Bacteroides sp.]
MHTGIVITVTDMFNDTSSLAAFDIEVTSASGGGGGGGGVVSLIVSAIEHQRRMEERAYYARSSRENGSAKFKYCPDNPFESNLGTTINHTNWSCIRINQIGKR